MKMLPVGFLCVYFVKVLIKLFRSGAHSSLLACSLIWTDLFLQSTWVFSGSEAEV